MTISERIASELNIKLWQAEAAIGLIEEGNTIPFIARYRKEAHGQLDDQLLRKLEERLTYLKNLDAKKAEVIRLIDEQGKLTEEIEKAVAKAETVTAAAPEKNKMPAAAPALAPEETPITSGEARGLRNTV